MRTWASVDQVLKLIRVPPVPWGCYAELRLKTAARNPARAQFSKFHIAL